MSDDFDSIIEGLEIEDPDDVLDVTTLSVPELVELKVKLERELFELQQALMPKTQEARDKHSLRNAVQLELNSRFGNG